MNMEGQVAVITGAASGIGRAVAQRLAADGAKVVLADIDEARLLDVQAQLVSDGAGVEASHCDVASESDVAALANLAVDRFGAVHVLFNNAGISGFGDAWIEPMDLWHRVIETNLYGVVHGIRAFLPIMTEQGKGHIVNTASMAGLEPMPGVAPYNAAKHAVVAISEGLYLELETTGSPVRVSVLCPGPVQTRIVADEPTDTKTPVSRLVGRLVREALDEEGMDPSDVANQVAEAIAAQDFWILTHEDVRHRPVERMQRAARNENPTWA